MVEWMLSHIHCEWTEVGACSKVTQILTLKINFYNSGDENILSKGKKKKTKVKFSSWVFVFRFYKPSSVFTQKKVLSCL